MKRFLLPLLVAYLLLCGVYVAFEKHNSGSKLVQEQTYVSYKEPIVADTLYTLVNAERSKVGVEPLQRNQLLDKAAVSKCSDMLQNSYYGHVNPTSNKHGYELAQSAVENEEYVSENLNRGLFNRNAEVIVSWNGSPAHKAAMLDPKYVDTGLAVCNSSAGTILIVQFFACYLPN